MGTAVPRRSISSLSARFFSPSWQLCLVGSRYTVFPNSSLSAVRQLPSAPTISDIARNFANSTMYEIPITLSTAMLITHCFQHTIRGSPEKTFKAEDGQSGSVESTEEEASNLSPDDGKSSADDSIVMGQVKKYNLSKCRHEDPS